jgi:hypothetical protein
MTSIPGLSSLQTQPEVQDHSKKHVGQCDTVSDSLRDTCATEGTANVSWSSSCEHAKQITLGQQQSTGCNYQCQHTKR